MISSHSMARNLSTQKEPNPFGFGSLILNRFVVDELALPELGVEAAAL